MIAFVVDAGLFLRQGAVGDVSFHAKNRFQSRLFSRSVKLDGAVHIAVVGKREGRHFKFLGEFHQARNLG